MDDILLRLHDLVVSNDPAAFKMLHGGDTDYHFPACSCETSCAGFSILYFACVHNRLDIVKDLLSVGADIEYVNKEGTATAETPYYYAIKHGNIDLMRLLLRDDPLWNYPPYRLKLHYGMFHKFHDDIDVVKIIMEAGSTFSPSHPYDHPCMPHAGNILYGAAVQHCSRLCQRVIDHCGLFTVFSAALEHKHRLEIVPYVIDVFGASKLFEENDIMRRRLMRDGCSGILEITLDRMYQVYGDNKASWAPRMLPLRRQTWCTSIMHDCIREDGETEEDKFECLLLWGVYSVLPNFSGEQSLFYKVAEHGEIECATMLIRFYPRVLQEQWFLAGDKPWTRFAWREPWKQEIEDYFETLEEARKCLDWENCVGALYSTSLELTWPCESLTV